MKRTKLLYKGDKRTDIKRYDTRILKRMKFKRLVIFTWVGLVIGLAMNFEENGTDDISPRLYLFIGFIGLYLLFLPFVIGFSNIERDRIYTCRIEKKGLFPFDLVIGKTFIPYRRIEKIGYGTDSFPVPALLGFVPFVTQKKRSDFLVIYQKGSDEVHSFLEIEYGGKRPNFYSRLRDILEEKCFDVPWEEMDWEDWRRAPVPRKKFWTSPRRRRRKPVRLCLSCGGKLTYIPQYNRWYCYECEEYAAGK